MTTVQDLGFAAREEIHWEIECSSDFCHLELDYRGMQFSSADDAKQFILRWLKHYDNNVVRCSDRYGVDQDTLTTGEKAALQTGHTFKFRLAEARVEEDTYSVLLAKPVEVQASTITTQHEQVVVGGKEFGRDVVNETVLWSWRPLMKQERTSWGEYKQRPVEVVRTFYVAKHTNIALLRKSDTP